MSQLVKGFLLPIAAAAPNAKANLTACRKHSMGSKAELRQRRAPLKHRKQQCGALVALCIFRMLSVISFTVTCSHAKRSQQTVCRRSLWLLSNTADLVPKAMMSPILAWMRRLERWWRSQT